MTQRIHYYPGFQPQFTIPGIALLVLAVALCYTHHLWLLSIPCFAVAFVLIVSIEGTEIDYDNRKVKNYTDFFVFRQKQETDLTGFEMVSIVFERKVAKGLSAFFSSGASSMYGSREKITQQISFEMYLYGLTREKFFLGEFSSHAEARKVAERMKATMGVKIEDTIVQAIALYKRKPHLRR
ncbi:MAG TPA: hypothetical protein VD905_04210 [Flavobacteriales bacterium]|nr:hypothetical protein [Flavobacteriales bacterium]